MNNIIDSLKNTGEDLKKNLPQSIPYLLVMGASVLSILGILLPFGQSLGLFEIYSYNIFLADWIVADIILILSIFNIYYSGKKLLIVNLILSILTVLFSLILFGQLDKNLGMVFLNLELKIGSTFLGLSVFLHIIAFIVYGIMKYIYKMEIRGNERLQLLNDFNSMADFFRKNTKRPIEYRLVFFGILVTSLSLLLPFQDKMGIHLNPGLSLSLIISLVILAMNFFSYVGIEINNEKNIYLATVVNTLLIFGWIFMVANKKDSSYAFGFFIYLIGILLMVGGTILHYRKNHMEENKEIYRKSERPEENKINKDI